MAKHPTGTREEWLADRRKLLDAEKTQTRRGDELAQWRRELPWVQIDKDYRFELALSMLQFPYQQYNGFATLIPPLFPLKGGCDAFSIPCTPACVEVEGLSANFTPRTTSREV